MAFDGVETVHNRKNYSSNSERYLYYLWRLRLVSTPSSTPQQSNPILYLVWGTEVGFPAALCLLFSWKLFTFSWNYDIFYSYMMKVFFTLTSPEILFSNPKQPSQPSTDLYKNRSYLCAAPCFCSNRLLPYCYHSFLIINMEDTICDFLTSITTFMNVL